MWVQMECPRRKVASMKRNPGGCKLTILDDTLSEQANFQRETFGVEGFKRVREKGSENV